MNYFSRPTRNAARPCARLGRRRLRWLAGSASLLAVLGAGPLQAEDDSTAEYAVHYILEPAPAAQAVDVTLVLEQTGHLLRELRFSADRVDQVDGDGSIETVDGDIVWTPPTAGGQISWRADAVHRRNSGGYDAWLDDKWGLFRAEDVIPRAASRTLKNAQSRTSLEFELPDGWSAVSEYRDFDGHIPVTDPDRQFAQPTGWIVVGPLGVRRERIAGTRVAIAAPIGEDVRRMDMLALLNWTLPELARVLPKMPERVTVFSAGKPMWRGGLSAPQSFYMHVDRPLISENGTSTLLHEVMHVALGLRSERGYDWIIEGFAEYYSVQLLGRSGTLTPARLDITFRDLANWAKDAEELCGLHSTGPETALAVTRFKALDDEIQRETGKNRSLDDVLRAMLASGERADLELLRSSVRQITGKNPDALHSEHLPGCDKID